MLCKNGAKFKNTTHCAQESPRSAPQPVQSPVIANRPGVSFGNGQTPDNRTAFDRIPVRSYERYVGKSWRMAAIVCTGVGACFTAWVLVYVLIKV